MNFRNLYDLNLQFINAGGKVKYWCRLPKLHSVNKLLSQNQDLIDRRKNDTCYVLGLGPSLGQVDLDNIQDMDVDTIVVNRFNKMASMTRLQPTHYLMIDNAFAVQPDRKMLDEAVSLYPDCNFIWNTNYPKLAPELMTAKCNKYFLAMYNGYYIKPKKIDITKVTPAFGNCICAAIAYALGLGYKKIVLLGCDFNSFAFPHEVHCYHGGTSSTAARRISLDYELFCYSFDATVHLQLAEYARLNNVEIINATRGSLIDAYQRVDMPELYKSC